MAELGSNCYLPRVATDPTALGGPRVLIVFAFGRIELGEAMLPTNTLATTDDLTRQLFQLGHLDAAYPLGAWMVLNLRAGAILQPDRTLGESAVLYGDFLYWRIGDQHRLTERSASSNTPGEAGEFSGTPASRLLRPSIRKDSHAPPVRMCWPPTPQVGQTYPRPTDFGPQK